MTRLASRFGAANSMMVELFMIHYVILTGYLRKGKCMKRSIQLPLIVLTSLLVIPLSYATPHKDLRQAHLSRCAKPVFYAQTANHKKEVEICIVSPSVSYSFGKVGVAKKEMDIFVPANRTSFASQSNRVYSISEFTIRNGDTTYLVSDGSNEEGQPFSTLDVYKGSVETGKHLVEIKLDPKTVVNNIGYQLADEGIPESDSL